MDIPRFTGLILLTITIFTQNVRCTGVMEIRFHRFQFKYIPDDMPLNSSVTPLTNVTNTSPWFSEVPCPGPPSYRFILCLDSLEHSSTSDECSLGRVDTGLVPVDDGSPMSAGMDTIFFGSAFQAPPHVLPNPMPFNFPEWPGGIRIKVYVSCCPSIPRLQPECQEELIVNYIAEPGKDRWSTFPEDVTLEQRNRLWLQVNLFCDASYYDRNCSTHCEIEDPTQHFMCNHLTGEKECTHGWEGADCNTDINECEIGVCQNDGGCKNLPGEYECLCKSGFTGLFCQYRVPGCPSNPCQNGGSCVDTDSGYVCYCDEPFTGKNCEMWMTTPDLETTTASIETGIETGIIHTEYTSHDHSAHLEPAEKNGEEKEHDNWYIIVIAIVCTALISGLLIGLVIWSNRRKKYKVNKAGQQVATHGTNPDSSPPVFENNLYMATNNETFGRQIPFGNGIFSNIGFDIPTEDGKNPYTTVKKQKKNKKASGATGQSAASGSNKGDEKASKDVKNKKSKGTSEPRENLYVPWTPDLVRNDREYSSTQMTEIDLNSQCDEAEMSDRVKSHEPVSSQISSHYAVSKPISEIRKDMMTSNPTGSLYSANRFKKVNDSPTTSPPGKRKTSVSSLVGGIVKWSPRSRKVSPDSEVDIGDLEMFNNKRERKVSNSMNISGPDITKDCLSPEEPKYTNMSRRRSSYNLLEMSPNHARTDRHEDIISLSSNSSGEGNNPKQGQHPQVSESGSEELDTSSQYVHMSGNLFIPRHDNEDSRKISASTIGRSVNASPVVSDSENEGGFVSVSMGKKRPSVVSSDDDFTGKPIDMRPTS